MKSGIWQHGPVLYIQRKGRGRYHRQREPIPVWVCTDNSCERLVCHRACLARKRPFCGTVLTRDAPRITVVSTVVLFDLSGLSAAASVERARASFSPSRHDSRSGRTTPPPLTRCLLLPDSFSAHCNRCCLSLCY
ncbi:hypothetical protein BCV70DRAFT_71318 [Testicularia cyperi]|uniref:Uncharacterized protein n=1 Tax=Testicularia cyperi TaxID=1882483 RepID=A0A317XFP4_9BASI|nr:hypothetical protein BCV70DRAFT_71318 [Testicularia cyperi]